MIFADQFKHTPGFGCTLYVWFRINE